MLKGWWNIFYEHPQYYYLYTTAFLVILGYHPICNKLTSTHVRIFSKKDVALFYNNIGRSFSKLERFLGPQFYLFLKTISKFFSKILPTMVFSSFYLIRKTNNYKNEFINWPKYVGLETNYSTG